jgi:hypothetical protein
MLRGYWASLRFIGKAATPRAPLGAGRQLGQAGPGQERRFFCSKAEQGQRVARGVGIFKGQH